MRAFPPAIRYSGLSFAYNIAYAIFGGLTPVITQLWLQHDPMAGAHYVALVSVLAMILAALPLAAYGWREQGASSTEGQDDEGDAGEEGEQSNALSPRPRRNRRTAGGVDIAGRASRETLETPVGARLRKIFRYPVAFPRFRSTFRFPLGA